MAGYIHWTIRKQMGLQVTDNYHKHISERVINVTIMWGVLVITHQRILANQFNILLHNKKDKTCLQIYVAIPDNSNFLTQKKQKN